MMLLYDSYSKCHCLTDSDVLCMMLIILVTFRKGFHDSYTFRGKNGIDSKRILLSNSAELLSIFQN